MSLLMLFLVGTFVSLVSFLMRICGGTAVINSLLSRNCGNGMIELQEPVTVEEDNEGVDDGNEGNDGIELSADGDFIPRSRMSRGLSGSNARIEGRGSEVF